MSIKNKYTIVESTLFLKLLDKTYKKDPILAKKVVQKIKLLRIDPFQRSLRTHPVYSPQHGRVYSSRVTGDIRLIWGFVKNNVVIYLYRFGGHNDVC